MNLGEVEDWAAYAACAGQPLHIFYPKKHIKADKAKAICARCPVRRQCLDEALRLNDHNGVWGGYSTEERKSIKRSRKRAEEGQEAA